MKILKRVYCENCKKTFVVNQDTYFCLECGAALTIKSEYEDPIASAIRKKRKRSVKITALVLSALIVAGGITGGVLYKNAIADAEATEELIESLPDSVFGYEIYDDLISNAYSSYLNLSDWQKERVSNRDKLLEIVPAYNEYKVSALRAEMQKVSVDSVEETTALADTVNLYSALTADQKTLLTSDEAYALENYVKVNDVIKGINDINDDLVNRYDEVNTVKKLYYSIDSQFAYLVYNYGLMEEFADKLDFLNLFVFEQNEGGTYSMSIKDPTTLSGKVVLPSKYNGQDVVKIPDYAFENCKNVTSFIIPDSVSEIGVGAFKGCNRLEEISLPFTGKNESSENIEAVFGWIFGYSTEYEDSNYKKASNMAFTNQKTGNVDGAVWQYSINATRSGYSNTHVVSYYFYIPSSLRKVTISKQTEIKTAAFNGCKNIIEIQYAKGLSGIGAASFQNCEVLSKLNSGEEGTVNLVGSYETIGNAAFNNCKSISNIIFPDESLAIEDYAFCDCENIDSLTLTNKIIKIGSYAFQGLKNIVSVVVPNTTETIGVGAFKGCNRLEEISLPFTGKNEASENIEAVFGWIFGYSTEYEDSNYKKTSNMTFTNQKTGNVDGAVWQYSINATRSGYSNTHVVSYYFYIPSSLKKVTISKQTEVKTAAFNGCKNIIEIQYAKGLSGIGAASFQNCEVLSKLNSGEEGTVNLVGSYETIGNAAFNNCKSISNIIFPDENLAIEDYAFCDCENIDSLTLTNKIIKIGSYAFQGLKNIVSVVVPNTTETIGVGAFKGCNRLEEISLPFTGKNESSENIEAVFGWIFGYSTEYEDSNYKKASNMAFTNQKTGSVNGAVWQYSINATRSGYSNTHVVSYYFYIPSSLKKITISKQTEVKTAAFNGCTMLTSITYTQGAESEGECAFQNCTATINK